MKSSLYRAVGALALLACLLSPSIARSQAGTPPGSAERIAKMEADRLVCVQVVSNRDTPDLASRPADKGKQTGELGGRALPQGGRADVVVAAASWHSPSARGRNWPRSEFSQRIRGVGYPFRRCVRDRLRHSVRRRPMAWRARAAS